jgi:hypothetical protein
VRGDGLSVPNAIKSYGHWRVPAKRCTEIHSQSQAQGCQAEPSAALKWPADEIEARLHLNDTQSAALEVLQDTGASAVEMLNAECRPDAITPPARLAAVKRQFEEPIPLPRGRQLVTLNDAGWGP